MLSWPFSPRKLSHRVRDSCPSERRCTPCGKQARGDGAPWSPRATRVHQQPHQKQRRSPGSSSESAASAGLRKSRRGAVTSSLQQTRPHFLWIFDEGYWLAIFLFFYREKGSRKGPHPLKKRVGRSIHLPTWSHLKTELEGAFSDGGGLLSPLLGDAYVQSLSDDLDSSDCLCFWQGKSGNVC